MQTMRVLQAACFLVPWTAFMGCGDDDDSVEGDGDADADADGDADADADSDADADGDGDGDEDPLLAALDRLRDASARPARVGFRGGFPSFLIGSWDAAGPDPVARAQSFLATHAALFGQGPEHDLVVGRVRRGDLDVVQLRQTWHGMPVWNGELTVLVGETTVFGLAGALEIEGRELDSTPRLGPAQAEGLVRDLLDRPDDAVQGDTGLWVFDLGLVDETAPFQPRLAYAVTFADLRVFVDAVDGSLLWQDPMAQDDLYLFVFDGLGTNDEATNCFSVGSYPIAATEDAVTADYLADQYILDMREHGILAYDYYLDHFGRDGYHGYGDQIFMPAIIFAHTNSGGGASWSSACSFFQWTDPFVGDDVFVHEYTHAVISYTSNLSYHNQSGALNESYADMMACLATGDWLLAEGTENGAIRSAEDPTLFDQPDHFDDWVMSADTKDGDWGGVHTNSGIPNKAAFLMTDGGEHRGRAVVGMGATKAERILYVTLSSLYAGSTFAQAAAVSDMAALAFADLDLLGFGPSDVCSVENAYAAVGMGVGDADCDGIRDLDELDDDDDGVPDSVDNCDDIPNPSQKDSDGGGLGDACTNDDDGDGVLDADDNCAKANPNQADTNDDGIGDRCQDFDGDGDLDFADNCAGEPNPDQADTDGDGDGDACDPDQDGDGLSAGQDNCPFDANADQADADGDELGDACDRCPDVADGATAWTAGIPGLGIDPQPLQTDTDGDGTPDACDSERWGGRIRVRNVLGAEIAPRQEVFHVDGQPLTIELNGAPGAVVDIPLPACPDDCPEWLTDDDPVELTIDLLSSDVTVVVLDDAGRAQAIATDPPPGRVVPPRTLGMLPEGLRRYRLRLVFEDDYPIGGATSMEVTLSSP